ncbi:hypothetical protein CCACVL1_29574, partial [Corchorus capsularis]
LKTQTLFHTVINIGAVHREQQQPWKALRKSKTERKRSIINQLNRKPPQKPSARLTSLFQIYFQISPLILIWEFLQKLHTKYLGFVTCPFPICNTGICGSAAACVGNSSHF